MSKSKPDTAIFMDDTEEDVNRKIKKAYCPEKQIEENPILEYCKFIVFSVHPVQACWESNLQLASCLEITPSEYQPSGAQVVKFAVVNIPVAVDRVGPFKNKVTFDAILIVYTKVNNVQQKKE